MFSLPDIIRLNSEASLNKRKLERAVSAGKLDGKTILCEHAAHDSDNCNGPISCVLWFDIFSDDPKGIFGMCQRHRESCGMPDGYFRCADCGRTFVTKYTWEPYSTIIDGEELCLPCACKRYIADPDNWLELTPENIAEYDFEHVRHAPHVIAVKMPVPDGLRFLDNCKFDSIDGHQISGEPIHSILNNAQDEGYTKVLVVLDAAYQFAVSIGVYVGRKEWLRVHSEAVPALTKSQQQFGPGSELAVGGAA